MPITQLETVSDPVDILTRISHPLGQKFDLDVTQPLDLDMGYVVESLRHNSKTNFTGQCAVAIVDLVGPRFVGESATF